MLASLSVPDLQSRYETLVSLRETQPEREAARAITALKNHRGTSESLIKALRTEIAACKEAGLSGLERWPPFSSAPRSPFAKNDVL